jgi:hypothetical protein
MVKLRLIPGRGFDRLIRATNSLWLTIDFSP